MFSSWQNQQYTCYGFKKITLHFIFVSSFDMYWFLWYVLVPLICIGSVDMYWFLWYVLVPLIHVCIGSFDMYWFRWYVLVPLICIGSFNHQFPYATLYYLNYVTIRSSRSCKWPPILAILCYFKKMCLEIPMLKILFVQANKRKNLPHLTHF